jgi:ATP-dependent Lon protease
MMSSKATECLSSLRSGTKKSTPPVPSDLYDIGTVSMVHRAMKTPEGNLFLIIMGVARVRVDEFTPVRSVSRAKIQTLQDIKEDETGVDFPGIAKNRSSASSSAS